MSVANIDRQRARGWVQGNTRTFPEAVLGLAIAAIVLCASPSAASIKVGSFTKATGVAPASQTIAHGRGETPKALILWTDGKTSESFSSSFLFAFGATDG